MAFKGLFIGIDRYDSPEINWLSCANRDAKALHALSLTLVFLLPTRRAL